MMYRYYRLLILSVILLGTAHIGLHASLAEPIDRRSALSEQRQALRRAATSADSIPVLYNIFDLSLGADRISAAQNLYNTSRRAGNHKAFLDATRQLANLNRNDVERLHSLRDALQSVPYSKDKEETMLFVDMYLIRERIESIDSEDSVRSDLTNLISEYVSAPPADPYQRALQLYGLCVYTERATHGELLIYYYDELQRHIATLHFPNQSVTNLVATRAAIALAQNDYHDRVLAIDQRMLATMDSMRAVYRSSGRPYRNYETNRYSSFRRMLGSYNALTDSQLEYYYSKIDTLTHRNPQIYSDLENNPRGRAFYLMGKRRYAEALPLLSRIVNLPVNHPYRRQLLEALVTAAEQTGNTEIELAASRELNVLLNNSLIARQHDSSLELSLFNAVTALNEQKTQLESAQRNVAEKDRHTTIIICGVALAIMMLLIALILRQLAKARHLAKQLGEINSRLRQEQHDLRHAQQELIMARDEAASANRIKSEFVATMSHEVSAPLNSIVEYTRLIVDCIPPEKAQYLDRFARTIEFNSKVILSLVKDVMDSDALEKDGVTVERHPVSVYQLSAMALNTIFDDGRPRNPELKSIFNPGKRPDVYVLTDSLRASQVLTNLLANAEKFTEKGTVILDFEPKPEEGVVEFSVTDTGIGIPDGLEELIFARFRKVNPSSPGVGLGLYIVRRIVTMLGGTVRLDKTYRRGARFLFTLPMANC